MAIPITSAAHRRSSREFRPREVWEGIPVPRFVPLTNVRLQTQASGARWANVYAGDHIVVDGVDVIVATPVGRRTGSDRRCGTTIRSSSIVDGAMSRSC